MKRRNAIKSLAMAASGLITIPAWASGGNNATVQAIPSWLSPDQDALLAEIVETIIPTTTPNGVDSPGAKALNIHNFVQKMVTDCYEKPVQAAFSDGLAKVEAMANQKQGKPFSTCDASQRQAVMAALETSPDKPSQDFFTLVKRLTVQGYSTSEYVMTTVYNYQPIPGHYYGCVPAPFN